MYNYFTRKIVTLTCLLILLLVATLNVLYRTATIDFIGVDAADYLQTAQLMAGETSELPLPNRILKPLGPGLITVGNYFFQDYNQSFISVAILFYFALAVMMFFFLRLFIRDSYLALIGSILYITAYPLLKYGIELSTETGAHFLYLFALFFICNWYQRASQRDLVLAALLVAVGFLWKEYSALAGLVLLLAIVVKPHYSPKHKINDLLLTGSVMALIIIPAQLIVYYKYGYTYLDWFREGSLSSEFTLYYIVKSLAAVYLLGWILAAIGCLGFPKLNRQQKFIIISLLLVSLTFFIWRSVSSRLYFVLAVPLTMLAIVGIRFLSARFSGWQKLVILFVLLSLIIAANYLWLLVSDGWRPFLSR